MKRKPNPTSGGRKARKPKKAGANKEVIESEKQTLRTPKGENL